MAKTLPSGIYAPLPVFFSENDELGKSPLCHKDTFLAMAEEEYTNAE
jgi:hypothetical protein